jgi:cyclopropane fatty-acyl-phospholipid synthase-like methyltransferase
MQLQELQQHWDELGKRDPLWAILSDSAKIHNQWDLGEFFKTGEDQVIAVFQHLDALHLTPGRNRALDFGCGVGRVTQALCPYFAECHGIDLSPSMIRQARQYNRFGARCLYHLNQRQDLALFVDGWFDFVFTFQVMQHMKPEYSRRYIAEFLRVLKPGGVLYLQVPSGMAGGPAPGTHPRDS